MTPSERRRLTIVGGALVALLLVLAAAVLLTGPGDDGDRAGDRLRAGRTSTTTTTVEETTTTAEPGELSAADPSTTSSTAAPPSSTTTTTTPPPAVGPQGAVLAAPDRPATRTTGADTDCSALATPGWSARCGVFAARDGRLVWLVESRSATDEHPAGRRAFVLRQRGSSSIYDVLLQAVDDSGTRFTDVRVAFADVSADGGVEALFGFHRTGTDSVLAVDLVEGPGRVVVHRELSRGAARVSGGQFDTWSNDRAARSVYIHDVIRFSGGAYRIVASSREAAPPPPSQV